MASISHFVRAVAALPMLGSASAVAFAQAPASPTGAPAARVEWAPAQPRQGSVVRITIRPAAAATSVVDSSRQDLSRLDSLGVDFNKGDATGRATAQRPGMPPDSAPRSALVSDSARKPSIASDTVSRAAAHAGAPLDSLRAVLDTLALRRAGDSLATAPDRPLTVRATLFGEPLHFQREETGEYVAIGGIPVDAPTAVRLEILLVDPAGNADTVVTRMPIRRTAYKMEQLTVAPKFGQAPDSALAARIAREQGLAAAVSRTSHLTPRLWEGEFRRPRAARVTSAFGGGRQFNGAIQSRHMGLDLAGAVGAPVVATNRGVVALVGDFYYAGNAVYIDHGAGLVTAYFHLSAVDVAPGDTVTPGMRIGRVGATGRVTGPHLHWVARYGSVTVDPSTLLEIGPAAPPVPSPPAASRRDPRQPGAG